MLLEGQLGINRIKKLHVPYFWLDETWKRYVHEDILLELEYVWKTTIHLDCFLIDSIIIIYKC